MALMERDINWDDRFQELMKENPRFYELWVQIGQLEIDKNIDLKSLKISAWFACKWQGALHLVK
jgi:hypothetical protein